MNKFFHKIKNVGRIVFISVLAIMLLVGCGDKDKENNKNNSQTESQQESQTDKNSETETGTEDVTETGTEDGTQDDTQTETETETETEADKTPTDTTTPSTGDNTGNGAGNSNSNTGNSGNTGNGGNTQTPSQDVTADPSKDFSGSGTEADPYLAIPSVKDNGLTLTTMEVAAGASSYYSIQRIGGMILTINNSNAYVICGEQRYDAVNGVVNFQIPAASSSEYVTLVIGNKAAQAAVFVVDFSNAGGSYMNPTIITSLNNWSISLEEGNETGHYYKYIATQAGTIRFYMSDASESDLIVTNNRSMANRSFSADASGTYIEVAVEKGDEIMIQVIAIPTRRGKFPAVHITWRGEYL